ncbi:gluconate 2-dehydrogenase subunit 3 family protein [Altererythrobacter sp. KTW20L]|uniref:gluconate 2-dehydrogenase subunit 3 family protein n=1 Tax=Altererythrobacter sp. KTW20L TaxID=2942210 RepID=UPI0020BDC551|nr:gluconate 2-dehydrogenase subunit 3 family protein [Altererythrobacter sp. KTW20L]MCL6251959.1 gluconate 2-dehydrogenase subunit 3 family protein [Altererythrobacter sp. KTW20L]
MEQPSPSRRQFLIAVGNLASASWIAVNWPQIASAAEHGHHGDGAGHASLTRLTVPQAAEVDAIMNLIVPGGAKPGARDAQVLYFIDNALGSFFAAQWPEFELGLAEFQSAFAAHTGSATPFSAAPEAQQVEWLHEVDETPFFLAIRRLTVLGLIALPKYGGNHEYKGWDLIGVENRHFWTSPFGFYDRDYPGFVPYPGTQPFTA